MTKKEMYMSLVSEGYPSWYAYGVSKGILDQDVVSGTCENLNEYTNTDSDEANTEENRKIIENCRSEKSYPPNFDEVVDTWLRNLYIKLNNEEDEEKKEKITNDIDFYELEKGFKNLKGYLKHIPDIPDEEYYSQESFRDAYARELQLLIEAKKQALENARKYDDLELTYIESLGNMFNDLIFNWTGIFLNINTVKVPSWDRRP